MENGQVAGSHEVEGSNPSRSTNPRLKPLDYWKDWLGPDVVLPYLPLP